MSNADLFALLCHDGMRGAGGVSKAAFYRLSYREIFESYFAEFTDDGELVPLRKRLRRLREKQQEHASGNCRLLPIEDLDIPESVLRCGVPRDFIRLWWALWRKRNIFGTEQLAKKWFDEQQQTRREAARHLQDQGREAPRGWGDLSGA